MDLKQFPELTTRDCFLKDSWPNYKKYQTKSILLQSNLYFIFRTTQILETRVLNNGEQLQRIISLAEM